MKYEIRRFQILQTARILALLYAIIGLLLAPFLVLASSLDPEQGSIGLAFALLLPPLYGLFGFVGTVIGAFIYNLVAGWVGGIGVELIADAASEATT
jgi:hypothetical protein